MMSEPSVLAAAIGLPEARHRRVGVAPATSPDVFGLAGEVDAKLCRASLLARVMGLAAGEQAIIGEHDARALAALAATIEDVLSAAEAAIQAERDARDGRQMAPT